MQGFLHGCQADLLTACEAFCSEEDARISAVRQRALLALAVAFLQHFVRANWTGPPEQAGGKNPRQRRFLWLQGLMEFENPAVSLQNRDKKIKSHQSHEPFGD